VNEIEMQRTKVMRHRPRPEQNRRSHQRVVTHLGIFRVPRGRLNLFQDSYSLPTRFFELSRSARHTRKTLQDKSWLLRTESRPPSKKESAYTVEQCKILSSKMQELSEFAKRSNTFFQDMRRRFGETVEQDAEFKSRPEMKFCQILKSPSRPYALAQLRL